VSFLLAGWAFEVAFIKLVLVVERANAVEAEVMTTSELVRDLLVINDTVIFSTHRA